MTRIFQILVAVCLSLLFSSCINRYHYFSPSSEELPFGGQSLYFDVYDIEYLIKYAQDTSMFYHPDFGPWARRELPPYLGIVYDDTMTYLSFFLGVRGRQREIRADSIKITLLPSGKVLDLDLVKWGTETSRGHDGWSTSIDPIVIPKSYRDDFEVSLVISLHDSETKELIERRPFKVLCEHKVFTRTFWDGK